MSHPCPKTLLETDGRILSGPKYELRILDTKYGKKGYDAVRINDGKHIWIDWVVYPSKTVSRAKMQFD